MPKAQIPLAHTGISWMVICDGSRMWLKFDVSDVPVSVVLKLLQQLLLSNASTDAPAGWLWLEHCVGNKCWLCAALYWPLKS